MTTETKLKAPFPAFGGKARVAGLVWERFGDPANYIEPFCFSAAMLLGRPTPPRIETLNDVNCYVSNFWRAVRADPEAVAAHADHPVIENDLHARHRWLVLSEESEEFRTRMRQDPDHYDAKVAGWWCWGACCWIGGGWCDHSNGPDRRPALSDPQEVHGQADLSGKRPQLHTGNSEHGRGVHAQAQKRPVLAGAANEHGERNHQGQGVHAVAGLSQKMPTMDRGPTGGRGINGVAAADSFVGASRSSATSKAHVLNDTHRPQIADAFARGRGVHANDAATVCADRRAWLTDWMLRLADRLRVVRVCCGHWDRVCNSPSVTTRLGVTGVFLDPPYPSHAPDGSESRAGKLYATDSGRTELDLLRDEVLAWCVERGDDPLMRVCVAGLDTDGYAALEPLGWEVVAWKSSGYQNVSEKGVRNAARERLWFSPHCLKPGEDLPLFAGPK